MARESLHIHSWRNTSSVVRSFVIAALLCLGIGLVAAPSASAHDQLISSNPTEGQRLGAAPSSITLSFSAELLTLGYEIRVMDADSKNWAQGTAALTRESLSQPVAVGMPEGEYQVRWRVVSSDGHPINGSFTFLVGENAKSGSIPGIAAPEQATASADASVVDAAARSSAPLWVVPALVGAGAGLALYVGYLVVSSVRRRGSAGRV